jgi:predicted ATP-dependent serine protease
MRLRTHRSEVMDGTVPDISAGDQLMIHRVLRTGTAPLDDLLGGFRAGEVTFFEADCDYANTLLHMLCVQAIDQFGEEVVWIDGGNTVNPYAIASMCKRLRIDARDALSRINISRAFTAYQMVSLIEEHLPEQIRACAPSTVIISSITSLFTDKDMDWAESRQLLRRCADEVSEATRGNETVTLLTAFLPKRGERQGRRMCSVLRERADEVVEMRGRGSGTLFSLPMRGRSMTFSPSPWNQSLLEDFGRGGRGEDRSHIQIGP